MNLIIFYIFLAVLVFKFNFIILLNGIENHFSENTNVTITEIISIWYTLNSIFSLWKYLITIACKKYTAKVLDPNLLKNVFPFGTKLINAIPINILMI